MAEITDTADSADPPSSNSTDDAASELYNLHEVLATEQRKHDARLPKPQNPPPSQPAPPITTSAPIPSTQPAANTTRPAPQYRYQSNAKDQQLTTQLFNWLLEGKLTNATLAHILAASAPIRKDLSEQLRTRHVEAGAFEQFTTSHPEPDYSLPLWEVDILVGSHSMEAGVIDPGSQIIAIRKDLADEVGAHINPDIRLEMQGANSATDWTLGCAENLSMQIGNVPFKLHAHVLENAPFQLLLG